MKPNLGTIDRIFRFALGIILLAAPFISGMGIFASGTATAIAVIAGLIMVATSAMRFCPLYRIFGIRTCKP
ncbi:MAG: YgaP family membrane protein [Pikeienuella sp.]